MVNFELSLSDEFLNEEEESRKRQGGGNDVTCEELALEVGSMSLRLWIDIRNMKEMI